MDAGDLDLLAELARAGSLSAAARARRLSVSTVARRIDALEASLKLRLVDRRPDGVRLTPAGQRIAELAQPLADQLGRVALAAASLRAGEAAEPVRVSATEFVISDVLAPALPALFARAPDTPVHLRSQAGLVSLASREADLAIRMQRPEGNSLIARKLAELRLGLFAAPGWLGGRDPAALDLRSERLLLYDDSWGRVPELDWIERHGLAGATALRTGSVRALLTACRAGAGIALIPVAFAGDALVEVPAPPGLPSRTPWLIAHRDLSRVPRIRSVHRWIVETFAALR